MSKVLQKKIFDGCFCDMKVHFVFRRHKKGKYTSKSRHHFRCYIFQKKGLKSSVFTTRGTVTFSPSCCKENVLNGSPSLKNDYFSMEKQVVYFLAKKCYEIKLLYCLCTITIFFLQPRAQIVVK